MRRSRLLCCVIAMLGGLPAAAAARPANVSPVARSGSSIVFEVSFAVPLFDTLEIAGKPHVQTYVDGAASVAAPGAPDLPARLLSVAVPAGADVSVSAERLDEAAVNALPPAPVPRMEPGEPAAGGTRIASPVREASPALYGTVSPAQSAWLVATSRLRDLPVARVAVSPMRYDPRSGRTFFARSVRVEVAWTGGGSPRVAPPVDAVFGRIYDAVLVNPEDAARFRTPQRALAPKAAEGDYFSATPNGWVKIFVNKRGFYRVAYEAFGSVASSLDLSTVRVYGGGGAALDDTADVRNLPGWMRQVAVTIEDGDGDGDFEPGDAIIFFGQGVDGWADDFGLDPRGERWVENAYTSENVYWLTWGGTWSAESPPARILPRDAAPAGGEPVRDFPDRAHFELNREYDPVLFDARVRWERWWWQALRAEISNPTRVYSGPIADPDTTKPVRLWARFWGANSSNDNLRDHYLKVWINGQAVADTAWDGWNRRDIIATGLWGRRNNTLAAQVPYQQSTATRTDIINLAWFELDFTHRLRAPSGVLEFSGPDSSGPVTLAVTGLASGTTHRLFDVSDPFVPVELTGTELAASSDGDSLAFGIDPGGVRTRLYLVRAGRYLAPLRLELDAAPSAFLRERTDAVDYIIVANPDLMEAARTLRDLRETNVPGIADPRVAVVSVQDIYDEFSWGLPDAAAIRNFLEFAFLNWADAGDPEDPEDDHLPRYAILLGDASFDPRDFDADGQKSVLLAYETIPNPDPYVVDDWFASFDGPSDQNADMLVGRLPAANATEAATLVGKTVHYLSHPDRSGWSLRTLLAADDICQAGHNDPLGYAHIAQTERLDIYHVPRPLDRIKLYLLEYGSSCAQLQKPTAQADLIRLLNQGAWIFNFAGHGGTTQLADERLLDRQAVPSLRNLDRLPLFLTASCAVGKFDSQEEGLGETMIKHPDGGSVATFAATQVAYASDNETLNNAVMDLLYPRGTALVDTMTTVGFATVVAKNTIPAFTAHRYVLQGDPALRLVVPPLRVHLARMDPQGARQAAPRDTLVRGDRVTVSGTVLRSDGSRADEFNGRAHVQVLDSEILRTPVPNSPGTYYYLPGAPVYRGDLEVAAGRFDLDFVVPKVLNSDARRGLGRIRVYVSSGAAEGVGAIDSLYMSTTIVSTSDTTGPEIRLVDFAGGTLRAGQKLAITLSDSSGINITQLQQSRAVTVSVKDRTLNDVIVSDLTPQLLFVDGYQEGAVEYSVPGPPTLTPGEQYTLVVRASDSHNNLSMLRQEFTFASQAGMRIEQAYAVPSPTSGPAWIFFKPTADAEQVSVKILTVAGRTIRTLSGSVEASRWETQPIAWDGRDEEGDGVANGVYFFKIEARAADGGGKAITVGKLAVSR